MLKIDLYKVVFEGDLLPGNEKAAVQEKLVKMFAIKASKASRLLSGKQLKIKSGLTIKHAKKYVYAIAKMGALAYIVPHDEIEVTQKPPEDYEKFTRTGSFDVNAYSDYFSEKNNDPEQEKSNAHKILSLDEVDATLDKQNIIDIDADAALHEQKKTDLSGPHKIMELQAVSKKILAQKNELNEKQNDEHAMMDIGEISNIREDEQDDIVNEISGVQKVLDLKKISKIVKKNLR